MNREELLSNLNTALTSRDVALAEVAEEYRIKIEEAEAALKAFDDNANVVSEVEAAAEGTQPENEEAPENVIQVQVNDEVGVTQPDETAVEDVQNETSPTAEEEEILRRAAEIEAKYQRN